MRASTRGTKPARSTAGRRSPATPMRPSGIAKRTSASENTVLHVHGKPAAFQGLHHVERRRAARAAPPDRPGSKSRNGERDGDLSDAYHRQLIHPDSAVHETAARQWCEWEAALLATGQAHAPDPRWNRPSFRLGFARLVTHYWRNGAWIEEGALLRDAGRLSGVPGVLIHGRRFQRPAHHAPAPRGRLAGQRTGGGRRRQTRRPG